MSRGEISVRIKARERILRRGIAQTGALSPRERDRAFSRDACDCYDLWRYVYARAGTRVCAAKVRIGAQWRTARKSRITRERDPCSFIARLSDRRALGNMYPVRRDAAARSDVLMQIHTSCGAGSGHQGVPGV